MGHVTHLCRPVPFKTAVNSRCTPISSSHPRTGVCRECPIPPNVSSASADNKIEGAGGAMIGAALKANKTLTSLDLNGV